MDSRWFEKDVPKQELWNEVKTITWDVVPSYFVAGFQPEDGFPMARE
jgi:hypothetical protein